MWPRHLLIVYKGIGRRQSDRQSMALLSFCTLPSLINVDSSRRQSCWTSNVQNRCHKHWEVAKHKQELNNPSAEICWLLPFLTPLYSLEVIVEKRSLSNLEDLQYHRTSSSASGSTIPRLSTLPIFQSGRFAVVASVLESKVCFFLMGAEGDVKIYRTTCTTEWRLTALRSLPFKTRQAPLLSLNKRRAHLASHSSTYAGLS